MGVGLCIFSVLRIIQKLPNISYPKFWMHYVPNEALPTIRARQERIT